MDQHYQTIKFADYGTETTPGPHISACALTSVRPVRPTVHVPSPMHHAHHAHAHRFSGPIAALAGRFSTTDVDEHGSTPNTTAVMVDAQDINVQVTHMTQAALLAVMKSCAELECRMTRLEASDLVIERRVQQVDGALDMIKTCQTHQWREQQTKMSMLMHNMRTLVHVVHRLAEGHHAQVDVLPALQPQPDIF